MSERAPAPSFTVVVPTRDRPGPLAACLDALARLDYPRARYDVVVVDDGGTAPLDGIVAAIRTRLDVHLVAQAHGGPGIARNRGIALARGDLVAFTDDDCLPEPGWLAALARRHAAFPGAAVGGRTVNALPALRCSAASQDLIAFVYRWYNADAERARFFATNNVAFPARELRDLGGFASPWPVAASEDRELCDRWIERGRRMVSADDAVVAHAHPLALPAFLRQHYTYGRGAAWLRRSRLERGLPPLRFEPPRFYATMLLDPIRRGRGAGAMLDAALLVASQAASAAGYLRERVAMTPVRPRASGASGQHSD